MQNIVHDSRLLKCASEIAHLVVSILLHRISISVPVHLSDDLSIINKLYVTSHVA